MSGAYYNEIEPYAAHWLRNLITAGLIAAGDVDERSIVDVQPDDVRGYTQAHFFAGIGGWSLALRLAGWPDDRPVWTGSCPCQPFSAAGRSAGFADERHLWPAFQWLVGQCRPPAILGEQVASAAAGPWLDLVQDDLEGLGYAFGAVPVPAAGVGAPHIRDRLWWVADAQHDGQRQHGRRLGSAARGDQDQAPERQWLWADPADGGAALRLGHAGGAGLEGRDARAVGHEREAAERTGAVGGVADVSKPGRHERPIGDDREDGRQATQSGRLRAVGGVADDGRQGRRQVGANAGRRGEGSGPQGLDERSLHGGPVGGFWADADWIWCRDGKARPVEPGTFPLAHGIPSRVGRLRAYGNAIVPQVAAEFIGAWLECRP